MLLSRKRGVSMMIGYVLLMTFAIIMGAVIYQWMSSYVPTETLECPDGVSVFIRDINCQGTDLTIDLSNNGRFAIDAYFLKYSDNTEQKIGTKPLTSIKSGGQASEGGVIFFPGQTLEPGVSVESVFEKPDAIYLVEITPIRYEVIGGKNRMIVCGDATVRETVSCS